MKSKYILVKYFLYIFSIIISSFSCTKNSQITFYWDETGCSDPWLVFYTADTFSQEAQNNAIGDYLLSENIYLISISNEYDSSKIFVCRYRKVWCTHKNNTHTMIPFVKKL